MEALAVSLLIEFNILYAELIIISSQMKLGKFYWPLL